MYTGPHIVTDGLVLSLDAGSERSYPGTGTTWYDLSGQGAHAEAVNMPTWNSNGYFEFDGTNDELHSVDISQEYRDLFFVFESDDAGGGLSMLFGKYNDQDDSMRFNDGEILSVPDINDWQNGSVSDVFVNGQTDALSSGNYDLNGKMNFVRSYRSNTSGFGTSFRYEISSSFNGRRLKGNLALILCYNRKLSNAEVAQNYNALKSRFGL